MSRQGVSYNTGRTCGHAGCEQTLTVRAGESAWHFNRRTYCNVSCASRARATTSPIPHGTQAGYQRCRKQPEGACELCREAQTRDLRERGYGVMRAARDRAMRELAARYPDDFQALLDKELSA